MTPQAQKYQQAGALYLAIAQRLNAQNPALAQRMTAAQLATLMAQSQAHMDASQPGQVASVEDMLRLANMRRETL